MTFRADSSLVDRILPSPDSEVYDRRGAPILAVAVHMAEGGGTDTHLDNPDGNSSHYVVKYDGDLVQMVPEAKAAGSINPKLIRSTDDKPFTYEGETVTYGISVLKACLGAYCRDPNRVVIAIEIEGFAGPNISSQADPLGGPNPAQEQTLRALVADIRGRRPGIGLIGHRDAQSYKACPGRRIPWSALGGHGPAETDMPGLAYRLVEQTAGTVTVQGTGHSLIRVQDRQAIPVPAAEQREAFARVELLEPLDSHSGDRKSGFLVGRRLSDPVEASNVEAAFFLASDVAFVAEPERDCSGPVAAENERKRTAVLAAVQEVYG